MTESSVRPGTLFLAFLRLGATAFGGPAMVAYVGKLAVHREWASQEEFAEGVALCQSIPGATAMQSAAFVGLRAGGVGGAAAAYAGFGLPAMLLMIAASEAYSRVGGLPVVQASFAGLRAMIVALVANAAFGFGRAHIRSLRDALIAIGCAVAFYARASPVAVIGAAVLVGILLRRRVPTAGAVALRAWPAGMSRAAGVIAVAALALVLLLLAFAPRLGILALVFIKVDALAFGGGFASIPLMFREAVEVRRWLDAKTFMDGIALGQVTPGPIVVTATFVGHQVAGIRGALVSTVAVFLPSFILVVGVAPWFGRLRARAAFTPALHAALLSFVGLLLSVTAQFARAVQWNPASATLAALAFIALRAGVDVLWVVLASGTAALVL